MKPRSWKTTLAGVLGGFIIALGPNVGARLQGDTSVPPVTLANVAAGAMITVLGSLAKDHSHD